MKSIEGLWLKYKGEGVVIFANGPSLLRFTKNVDNKVLPDEFYDCKWVGINYSFEKLPGGHKDLDHIFLQELETYKIISSLVPNNKLIIPETPGLNKHGTAHRVKVMNKEAYGYPLHDPMQNRQHHLPKKDYSIDKDVEFFSYTTTTQTALHICCYLGFVKIYLVGVDYKLYGDGQVHYNSKHDKNYGPQKINALKRHQEGDSYLIPTLEKTHNVKIMNMSKYL